MKSIYEECWPFKTFPTGKTYLNSTVAILKQYLRLAWSYQKRQRKHTRSTSNVSLFLYNRKFVCIVLMPFSLNSSTSFSTVTFLILNATCFVSYKWGNNLCTFSLNCPYKSKSKWNEVTNNNSWGHPLSMYAKFSEKLTFLTPWYAHVRVRIRGLKMLVLRKILRTYLMDGPFVAHSIQSFENDSWLNRWEKTFKLESWTILTCLQI